MEKFRKIFPYIIFFAAISISSAAAYYSVYGLSRLFAGAKASVIVMASSLEFSKLVIATGLKLYWDKVEQKLKYYLLAAMVILVILTSGGIYGYLSDAYKQTADKDKAVSAKVGLLQKKKERFELQLVSDKKEKDAVNESISKLRSSLATDNQYQTVVKGQLVTQIQSTSKKGVQGQLDVSNAQLQELTQKTNRLNDSVDMYDLKILDFESREHVSELGPLKYLSTLTGVPMDNVINWFLILIMVVFDPLAIALVLLSIFAFAQLTPPIKPRGKVGRPKKIIIPPVEETVKPEPSPTKPKRTRKPKPETLQDVRKFNIEVPDLDSKPLSVDEAIQTPVEIKVAQNANNTETPIVQKVRPRQKRTNKVVDTSLNETVASHLKDALTENKKKIT